MDDDKLDAMLSDINRAVQRFVDEAQMVSVRREVLEKVRETLDVAEYYTDAAFGPHCVWCGSDCHQPHGDNCMWQAAIAAIEGALQRPALK